MFRAFLAALLIAAPGVAQAATVIYDLGSGQSGYGSTLTYTSGNNSATLTPYLYTVAPTSLTSTSQFVATDSYGGSPYIVRQTEGVSVATESEGNTPSEYNQIDTSGGTNEILKLSLVGAQQLSSVTFNYINSTDTLRIYGNNNGSTALNYLGFSGTFYTTPGTVHTLTGTSGATASVTDPSGTLDDSDPVTVLFSRLPVYQNYFFTSNTNTNDGYRISAVTVTSVPESSTWAMMLVGFGAMGWAMRRRAGPAALA